MVPGNEFVMEKIAEVACPLDEKFGLPRQSGLAKHLQAELIFLPEFSEEQAFRGLEQFSHLWVLWGFSSIPDRPFSPLVRPPKLGGNEKLGVFATRSPFRPNPIGLTVVQLLGVRFEAGKAVLTIAGPDMQNGTPVYDVKPYIPYADCVEDAKGGFAQAHKDDRLTVVMKEELRAAFSKEEAAALEELLALDPRPAYQEDDERVYGLSFGGKQVRFRVKKGVLTVCSLENGTK